MVNASILPLLFISNVFIPTQDAPDWLSDVASLFPVSHLAEALHTAFNPFDDGQRLRGEEPGGDGGLGRAGGGAGGALLHLGAEEVVSFQLSVLSFSVGDLLAEFLISDYSRVDAAQLDGVDDALEGDDVGGLAQADAALLGDCR